MNWMHESLFLIFHANGDAPHVKNSHFSVLTAAAVTAVEVARVLVLLRVVAVEAVYFISSAIS